MDQDYKEQQENELAALQSIYPEEFHEANDDDEDDPQFRYRIELRANTQDSIHAEKYSADEFGLVLRFQFTERYPDELPVFDVDCIRKKNKNEDDEDSEEEEEDDEDEAETSSHEFVNRIHKQLKPELDELAQQSMGMAMIFTLAGHCQEWLDAEWERHQVQMDEAEDERKRLQEEADQKRFHGTPVTPETFLAWKLKFDKEQRALNKERMDALALKLKKPSGRQLFETDRTLVSSDANYLDEGDVDVDVALFQDEMEGLDLEDSGDDDEDQVAAIIRASGE